MAPKPCDKQRKWFKARVENQVDIRSYEVRTEDGKVFRRNRRHLCQSKELFGQTAEASPGVPRQDSQPNALPATAEPTRPQATGQPAQYNLASPSKQTKPLLVSPKQEPPPSPNKPATVVTRSGRVSLRFKKISISFLCSLSF